MALAVSCWQCQHSAVLDVEQGTGMMCGGVLPVKLPDALEVAIVTLKNRNMIPVVERFAEKRIKERRARTLDAGFNRFSLLLPWSRALLEPPSPEVSRDLISLQSSMIRERFHAASSAPWRTVRFWGGGRLRMIQRVPAKARKLLATGIGINKVAKSVGLSNGTAARVKGEMTAI